MISNSKQDTVKETPKDREKGGGGGGVVGLKGLRLGLWRENKKPYSPERWQHKVTRKGIKGPVLSTQTQEHSLKKEKKVEEA